MSHRRSLLLALASGGGAATLALGLLVGAPSASAIPIPTSQIAASGGDLTDPVQLTGDLDDVGAVTDQLRSQTGNATGTGSSAPSPTGSGDSGASSGTASGQAPLAPVGSGVKDVLDQTGEKTKGTPIARAVPGSGPGEVLKLSVNATPLATACLEVTGSGTAVANLDVTVGGHDVGRPLVEILPGLLAPCPSGSVPTERGADAAVSDLVGACVRITDEPPLEGRVVVLDRELVAELTQAGVPLEKLVVPCPTPGQGGGDDGGGDSVGDGATGDNGTGTPGTGAPSGADGAQGTSGDAACDPTVNAEKTASLLPTSTTQALPWVLLALALVGRRRLAQALGFVRTQVATNR